VKNTAVAQQSLEINLFGAEMKLRIGIDSVALLWSAYNPGKRRGISGIVLVLSEEDVCGTNQTVTKKPVQKNNLRQTKGKGTT